VKRASDSELATAVVCLMNRIRARWSLPPLHQLARLDFAAQIHSADMVVRDYFGHTGTNGSSPGARLDQAGFRWSALGEAITTGYSTPAGTVYAWLGSADHCRIILSPSYRDIGVGVSPGMVRRWANRPGTWTADLALRLTALPPSGDWAPANGCPY
jgi:uncharacterized protein YkwD